MYQIISIIVLAVISMLMTILWALACNKLKEALLKVEELREEIKRLNDGIMENCYLEYDETFKSVAKLNPPINIKNYAIIPLAKWEEVQSIAEEASQKKFILKYKLFKQEGIDNVAFFASSIEEWRKASETPDAIQFYDISGTWISIQTDGLDWWTVEEVK